MTASALRPKTNMRRLLYFLGISLAVHLVLLVVLSIDFIFGSKPKPPPGTAAPVPAATPEKSEQPAAKSEKTEKPAPGEKPAAAPAAPAKPKDADAEYQKRQKPATDGEKKQAESIRPDLDQLK